MTPRTFGEITADALRARCGECWAEPGQPCQGGVMHIARYQRARRRGLLSADDMTVVLASVIKAMAPFVTGTAA
jgi:hypothetical protein